MKNVCCLKRTWSTLRAHCFTRSHDGHLWLVDNKGKGILRIVAPWMLKQSLPFGIISPANWGSLVIPMSEEMETNSNKSWQNCSVEAMRNKLRPVGSFWSRRNLYFQSHCTTFKMSLEIVSLRIHFAADFLLLRESREVGKFPLFEPTNLSIRKSFVIRKNKNYRRSLICLMSLSFWGEKSRPTLWGWKMYERLRQFS